MRTLPFAMVTAMGAMENGGLHHLIKPRSWEVTYVSGVGDML